MSSPAAHSGRAYHLPVTDDLYLIADELRALANLGLNYAESVYDRDRYTRVLGLSARLVAWRENREPAGVLAQYAGNLEHVSPLGAASAKGRTWTKPPKTRLHDLATPCHLRRLSYSA